jgi:hypothetical protein
MAGLDPAIHSGRATMHVAVIDIGKPDKNLGWAIRGPRVSAQGENLDDCISTLCSALSDGPLALGFEAPLFVPMRDAPSELTKARNGECAGGINRPFSAGAGALVLVTGLVVIPYVLARLREVVSGVDAVLNWRAPLTKNSLLLFEAFVSNQKSRGPDRHIADADLAIAAFRRLEPELANFRNVVDASTRFNLLGAMLLRTGWATDPIILHEPCLVVKV